MNKRLNQSVDNLVTFVLETKITATILKKKKRLGTTSSNL